jgi:hypothetical protein
MGRTQVGIAHLEWITQAHKAQWSELGKGPSDSIKYRELLRKLRKWRLLNKDSVPWSSLVKLGIGLRPFSLPALFPGPPRHIFPTRRPRTTKHLADPHRTSLHPSVREESTTYRQANSTQDSLVFLSLQPNAS